MKINLLFKITFFMGCRFVLISVLHIQGLFDEVWGDCGGGRNLDKSHRTLSLGVSTLQSAIE